MSVALSALLGLVRIEAAGAPLPLVESKVRLALVEYCQRTDVHAALVPFDTVIGQPDYDLTARLPAGTKLSHIRGRITEPGGNQWVIPPLTADQNRAASEFTSTYDRPYGFVVLAGTNVVQLRPAPVRVASLQAWVVLQPADGATALADVFSDPVRQDAVASGAKYHLFKMHGMPWSDVDVAVVNRREFYNRIAAEKARVDASFTDQPDVVRMYPLR